MRILYCLIFGLGISQVALSENSIDERCEKILAIVSDLSPKVIEQLYAFKKNNNHKWHEEGKLRGVSYTLEPKETITYKLLWTIGDKPGGSLECELPISWQLSLSSLVSVVYPKATHGQNQDLPLYNVTTIAGIYLAKTKYSIESDLARIMWHLKQDEIPADTATKIFASHGFLDGKNTAVTTKALDMTHNVQLVALGISNQRNIEQGNRQWLVTGAEEHRSILDGTWATLESKHDMWLPWFNPDRPEFMSTTPLEAYKTTVVAPVDQAFVYDLSTRRFLPEPMSIKDNAQRFHDVMGTPVYSFLNGQERLFAHLVLKQPQDYKLLTFEILKDGGFQAQSMISLEDPSQIALPSAHQLGFMR